MKIYLVSSASTPYGALGRGWHESKLTAERLNKPVKEIEGYFKALIRSGMAELPKKSPVKKTTAKKATNKNLSD